MKDITMTSAWSPIVAPVVEGVLAGVRPQDGTRRVDDVVMDTFEAAGTAASVTGHRPWSPPIT